MNAVVYPGTFDPLTHGHLDLIRRCSRRFGRVIVACAGISMKPGSLFPVEDRMAMIREACSDEGLDNIEVDRLDTMLVDYCRKRGVDVVVRGLRVYSDFEYEFQMALTNRKLAPEIETLFMMPSENYSYVTASMIREIARYAGDTSAFVPPAVQKRLKALK